MSKEYENGSEDNEVHPINPEEKQDILKSVGALGEQVRLQCEKGRAIKC
jgi:hypothetical protein